MTVKYKMQLNKNVLGLLAAKLDQSRSAVNVN